MIIMAMYLGRDKINEIKDIIPEDKEDVKKYLNNEIVGGGNLDGIKSIRMFAYYNQKNLESIILPETLETLGSRAFYGCSSLKRVTCKAKNPPTINTFDSNYFGTNIEVIYVPIGCYSAYSSANKWSQYADKIVEKEGL